MAMGVEGLQDAVTDVAGDHVDNQVGGAVVGGCGVEEVEGGWGIPGRDVKEMHVKPRFAEFAGYKGANQTAPKAVNPHAFTSGMQNSKVSPRFLSP